MRVPVSVPIAIIALSSGALAADDAVVARVGPSEITARAVTNRLAGMSALQLRALGDAPAAIRHGVVETILVPEQLFALEAQSVELSASPWVRSRFQNGLRRALEADLLREIRADAPITDDDIAAYYAKHRARFTTPERVKLWRILVEDEALARKIIDAAHGKDGVKRWDALAREHSVDAATKMRKGDLGFVQPDGHTDRPQVQVDRALYEAARTLANGEVVTAPVQEGERFAIVWRRGSLPAVDRTIDDERDAIIHVLERQRVGQELASLIAKLRKAHVRDINTALVDQLPGTGPTPPYPGSSSSARPAGDPRPRKTESGLR